MAPCTTIYVAREKMNKVTQEDFSPTTTYYKNKKTAIKT
jgi:hypothetical protein